MHNVNEDTLNEYVVILRAPSTALFPHGGGALTIQDFPVRTGRAELTIQSHFTVEGFDLPVPHGLITEVVGKAASLKDAVEAFGDVAAFLNDVIGFTTNVAVHEIMPHIAYDRTAGRNEHDFVQFQLSLPDFVVKKQRPVHPDAIMAFLRPLWSNPDEARLCRALTHYNQALRHWKRGHEIVACSFLWIAVESLTKVLERREHEKAGTTGQKNQALAAHLGIDVKNLDGHLRLTHIFLGDKECYEIAAGASNEFEHSYEPFPVIHPKAVSIRDKMARYVRNAILDLIAIEADAKQILLSHPYEEVLPWADTPTVSGKIVGDAPPLAKPDKQHPYVEWTSHIVAMDSDDDGNYYFVTYEDITTRFAEGLGFRTAFPKLPFSSGLSSSRLLHGKHGGSGRPEKME